MDQILCSHCLSSSHTVDECLFADSLPTSKRKNSVLGGAKPKKAKVGVFREEATLYDEFCNAFVSSEQGNFNQAQSEWLILSELKTPTPKIKALITTWKAKRDSRAAKHLTYWAAFQKSKPTCPQSSSSSGKAEAKDSATASATTSAEQGEDASSSQVRETDREQSPCGNRETERVHRWNRKAQGKWGG